MPDGYRILKTTNVGPSIPGGDYRLYHERVFVRTHPALRLNEYGIERRNRSNFETHKWQHTEAVSWARADEQGYDDQMLAWLERHLKRELDEAMFGPKMQPSAVPWTPDG
jgi:hypothetical protein